MGRLEDTEIRKRLQGLSGWAQSGNAIEKTYSFEGFAGSIAFVNRVAQLAEQADHHPDILIQYDKVKLTLSSHDSGGVTDRDLRLAAAVDAR
jgi:4a-hydroxytetrahydrobiopterin dehydratase